MYSEQRFYVVTRDPARQSLWDRLFHTDRLPVRSPRPSLTPGLCLAYRLDAAALSQNQITRLVGWLVWFRKMTHDDAAALVREGFPIAADGVELVVEQERGRWPAPAFVLSGRAIQPGLFLC
jgi:hypothetical protein